MAHEHPSLSALADSLSKPTRSDLQLGIEAALVRFRPDAIEAEELLPALLGWLVEDEEICLHAKYLRKALERLSRKQTVEPDEMDLSRQHRDRDL